MSITIKEIVAGVRDYLMYPDYKRVTNATVLLRIQDKADHQRQMLNVVDRGWFLSRVDLPVDPGTDEFPISATSFGRPVTCLTKDDSDPYHTEREVELVVVQNRDLFYRGPKTSLGSYALPHIAACISVYNDVDRGSWYAKVTPQHTQSATYVIWYQPDRPQAVALNDNYPLLESFINLLKVDVALSLLPNILITDDVGNVKNAAQVTLAERRLMDDRTRYETLFNTYRTMSVNEQTGANRGWAEDSGMEYWW